MNVGILLYATPVGLMLDIAGFLLIIRYGHSLFLRVMSGDLPDRQDSNLYLRADGVMNESKTAGDCTPVSELLP